MGGKNPAIVFADCDFDAAIDGTMRSCFANCGQVCLGTERVYVERPIFDRFVAALAERTRKLKIGVPEDGATGMGPLISLEHRSKVLSYYKKAVEELERAVNITNNDPTITEHLGDAYRKMGKLKEAGHQYDDALKKSQESGQQTRLKDKIQDLRTAMGGGAASAGH